MGLGGSEGSQIEDKSMHCIRYIDRKSTTDNMFTYGKASLEFNFTINITTAEKGSDGLNADGIRFPENVNIIDPSHIVNRYKRFALREFPKLNNITFVKALNHDKNICSLYDTSGFINELQNMEEQYFLSKNKTYFVPFFESLSTRIVDYAEVVLPTEHKKILALLYTASISKISRIKSRTTDFISIINLNEYLGLMMEKIQKLKQIEKNLAILEQEYKKTLENEIRLIYEIVENNIEPELNVIFNETNERILNSLKSSNEYVTLDKPNLYFPSITNISMSDSSKNRKIEPNFPENFTLSSNLQGQQNEPNVNDLVYDSIMKNRSNLQQGLFFYTLNELQYTILDSTNEMNLIYLDDILQKSKEWQSKILERIRLHSTIDSNEIESMYRYLKNLVADKKSALHPGETTLLYSLETISDRLENYGKYRVGNDDAGLSEGNKTEGLDGFSSMLRHSSDRYVFTKMVSELRKVEKLIYNITQDLKNKSQNILDEEQWRLHFRLRDLQVLFRQISSEIPHRDAVERNFEKLGEFIDILFDFHKRINSNSDKIEMLKYFEKTISLDQSIKIENHELNNAIQRLQKTIKINMIMDEYHLMMHAFKQQKFPFAHEHMMIFKLPKNLQFDDPETLMQNILRQIDYLTENLKSVDISKYDRGIFRDVDFGQSDASILGPFYIWNHDEVKEKLHDLLSGNEIEIIADVNRGVSKSAVKFNVIELRLKTSNDTQEQLNNELKNFSIALTLSGNYSYRCDDKIYCIPVDNKIVLTYSFQKDLNGNPILANEVYRKVSNNNYFFSPYGTWKIQLIANVAESSFEKLIEFEKHYLNLELIGRGQYFDLHKSSFAEICTDELSRFYEKCF